ncbi:uncharacterized protein PFL1_02786 [Pseudozyma flocculosa PF-1]|uniref:Protein kinase domain-containing protein n=2 Tax=Pseudozyma flocculosa TaxID=84751 RepID=A0A5C3F0S0_9BASI|nr:uncharacterized protein PFL1_02786 [Pseudozyma flocculosa PF-1]EPQ29567.1 hypothetical protein PFL1_02786 [Pseudozyma flocculosa PF-1]SPO38114.1 uncharacterized protein PSFLO_03591 [Pseudozyma flocculosa]
MNETSSQPARARADSNADDSLLVGRSQPHASSSDPRQRPAISINRRLPDVASPDHSVHRPRTAPRQDLDAFDDGGRGGRAVSSRRDPRDDRDRLHYLDGARLGTAARPSDSGRDRTTRVEINDDIDRRRSDWSAEARREQPRTRSPSPPGRAGRRHREEVNDSEQRWSRATRSTRTEDGGSHRSDLNDNRQGPLDRSSDADRGGASSYRDRSRRGPDVSGRREPRAPLAPRGIYDDSGRRLDREPRPDGGRHPRATDDDQPPPRKRLRDRSVDREPPRELSAERTSWTRPDLATPQRRSGTAQQERDRYKFCRDASPGAETESARPISGWDRRRRQDSEVRERMLVAGREGRDRDEAEPRARSPPFAQTRGPDTDTGRPAASQWRRHTPPPVPRVPMPSRFDDASSSSSSPRHFPEHYRASRQRTPPGPAVSSAKGRDDADRRSGDDARARLANDEAGRFRGPQQDRWSQARKRREDDRDSDLAPSSRTARVRDRTPPTRTYGQTSPSNGERFDGTPSKRRRSRAEQYVAGARRTPEPADPDRGETATAHNNETPLRPSRSRDDVPRAAIPPLSHRRLARDDRDADRHRDGRSFRREHDRYEPSQRGDTRGADDRPSRRSRSPSYSGRVLSRKEGSSLAAFGRDRVGTSAEDANQTVQTVRGGGWKTVRAPTRSPEKTSSEAVERANGAVQAEKAPRDRNGRSEAAYRQRSDDPPRGTGGDPFVPLSGSQERSWRRSDDRANPRTGRDSWSRRSPPESDATRRGLRDRGGRIVDRGWRGEAEGRRPHDEKPPRKASPEPEPEPAVLAPMQAEAGEGYVRINQVGEGTYGQVFKARSQRTGVLVALKKIRMEAEKDGFPVTAMREIKLLQALRHDNIVRLHEMMVARSSVYMVFEYMEHDLNGILAHPQIQFSAAHLKSLSSQLLQGLAYLHHKSVLHRDLKGSNILLNNQGLLKLADFGLARFYLKRQRGDYTNRVVTLWYRPPELLFGATQYGPEVDMWGAGCIFLELFTRKPAFQGNTEVHQLQVISDALGLFSTERWPAVQELPWYELVKPVAASAHAQSAGDGTAVPANADPAEQGRVSTEAGSLPQQAGPTANHASTTERSVEAIFEAAFGAALPASALEVARGLLSYDPRRRVCAAEALEMAYFGEAPRAEMPAGLLSSLEGEWHEYESRRARRKATKQAHDRAQADARAAHDQAQDVAAATSRTTTGATRSDPAPCDQAVRIVPERRHR